MGGDCVERGIAISIDLYWIRIAKKNPRIR